MWRYGLKKRIMSVVYTLLFVMGLAGMSIPESHAASNIPMIDGSYLTHDEESIGYNMRMTRGVDLLTGYSKSVRLGVGVLYAGGTTIAAQTVEKVGVGVIIERAKLGDDHWTFYEYWEKFNENADSVSSNRRMEVEGDYYYRVRSTHSANNDVSSSFTDGVYIK